MNSILILLGVLLGYYLRSPKEINEKTLKLGQKIGQKAKQGYGKPFVVSTNEAEIEKELKGEEIEKEIIDVKDAIEYIEYNQNLTK